MMVQREQTPHVIEQQLACVRYALEQLRQAKPFRGQEELIRDTQRQLAILFEIHKRARPETTPIS